jgi:tryptophan synthase beta chain
MSEYKKKFVLDEERIPKAWYNIVPDLPTPPAPPLHPGTLQPAGPDDLAPIFPPSIIAQEVSAERYIEIPEEVHQILRMWRPSPLIRATGLEKALDTPARIFYKYEGVSPAGSHKSNTAVAQAYYNKIDGTTRLATETGAGQWGSALSMACQMFGLECMVYMVKVSYHQKPYRRSMMQLWGADVIPSPSDQTNAGRAVLAEDPESLGSLGIAISEAVEDAVTHPGSKYALGSVTNHVLLHQTIIGEEAILQCQDADAYPDVVVGCVGGGSSFAGIAFPFLRENLAGKTNTRFVAVEPTACPTLTKGKFVYDFGDEAQSTPLFKMYSLGHDFMPAGIHAGGLRYHAMAPLISHVYGLGLMEAVAVPQTKVFAAAQLFAQTEGIVPAPESAHAILTAINEALEAKEAGESRNILFNLTGHGFLDLGAYDAYLSGKLEDYDHPEEAIAASIARLPKVD